MRRTSRRPPAVSSWDDDGALDDEGDDRPSGLRRLGRVLGLAGGGVAVLGALAIGLFPTQTFLQQRSDTAEAQERLAVLRAQNRSFEDRIDRLSTDEEIERLAREQYNLAFPGEEAYAVLPAPLPPLSLPEVWPFGPLIDPATEPGASAVP
jgi:cell division protein FtsB